MDKALHISDADFILLMDRELSLEAAANMETHLQACVDCRQRLESLGSGAAAYEQYRERVLKPALDFPATEWPALRDRLVKERSRATIFQFQPALLWAAAVFACCVIAATFYFRPTAKPGAQELLTKAAAMPESPRSSLLLITGGHRWSRPAVLRPGASGVTLPAVERSTFEHVHALFVQAHYSWDDPLSARSFAAWRNQLPDKQDQVSVVRSGDGERRFYRLRTRTQAGILRSASLTLRADTYHATNAAFEFQDEEPVELAEQSLEASPRAQPETQRTGADRPKMTETVAGPEDELRVFAMLSAIGVDAEEPIDVKLDPGHRHVLVTGMGMPPVRQREVERALAELPNTIVRFDSAQPARDDAGALSPSDTYSADTASAFRHILETRAGGPRQLQAITDRALDTSNGLFAQAHSLLVLAQEFPPEVESGLRDSDRKTLLGLQQRHVGAIQYAARQLGEDLKPLLDSEPIQNSGPPDLKNSSWQGGAANLFEAARNLDQLVSRLLSGSYPEQAGGEMLNRLTNNLSSVEMQARAQAMSSR